MTETTHLRLPYLAAAQAQKHVTHNEALLRLDAVVQLAVIDAAHTTPPGSPDQGDRYIIADGASGDWAGHEGHIAAYIDGAWVLFAPGEGWIAFDAAADIVLLRRDGAWQPIGDHLGVLDRLGVNTPADEPNRLAVRSSAVLLTAIGAADGGTGDIRCVINKEADADTASFLFQRNFSGRAEIGLAGDSDFVFKVSADGASWTEAIRIDRSTGRATLAADPAGPLQAATKQYVDQIIAAQDAMVFKGVVDCSANPNYPAADRGWSYRVSVAGRIGGGSGINVEAGDLLLCLTDGTATGSQASVGANWAIVQTNLDGAVIGPASATDSHFAQFDGVTGKLLKGGKAAPAGTVVGTSDAQTLTNKTISTANNTITAASDTTQGVVELATSAEAQAGTDTARAVTPAGLRAATREKLTASRTYYVRTDGSDSNTGLADSAGGAFLTIQKAVNVVSAIDLSIYDVAIQVRDGTYVENVTLGPLVGSGTVTIRGNTSTPGNVVVEPVNTYSFLITNGTSGWAIDSLKCHKASGSAISAIRAYGSLEISNVDFGAGFTAAHILAEANGYVQMSGAIVISGSCPRFAWISVNGILNKVSSGTITCIGTPAFSTAFIVATTGAVVGLGGAGTVTGAATGKRFDATLNGVITYSSGVANLPGDVAGTTSTGGQAS